MSITGMNHAVLYVRDSTRHRQFYEDVLGFKPSAGYERWQCYEIEGAGGFGISDRRRAVEVRS